MAEPVIGRANGEKPKLIHPAPEEDAAINAAIANAPDAYELNDQEFAPAPSNACLSRIGESGRQYETLPGK